MYKIGDKIQHISDTEPYTFVDIKYDESGKPYSIIVKQPNGEIEDYPVIVIQQAIDSPTLWTYTPYSPLDESLFIL